MTRKLVGGSPDGARPVRSAGRASPHLIVPRRRPDTGRRPSSSVAKRASARAPSGSTHLAQARARSYRVLSSRPTESEAKLSFAALGDLLDGVVDEVLDALPPPQRSALEVALLRAEAAASPPDRRTLSSAFHGALMTLATTGPLVLAIDDVQWLDLPSARVSGVRDPAAARRADRDPRHGASRGARPAPARSRSSAPRRADTPTARRSDHAGGDPRPAERGALDAPASFGPPPDPWNGRRESLPRLGAGASHPSAGGSTGSPAGSLPVPSTLVDLVADRLAGLSDPVRHVLLLAAAASQPTASLVAQAIGGTDADRDIEAALDEGVIEASAGRIRPAHPLLATVQYSVSSGPERERRAPRARGGRDRPRGTRETPRALAADRPDEDVAAALAAAARQASGRGAPGRRGRVGRISLAS